MQNMMKYDKFLLRELVFSENNKIRVEKKKQLLNKVQWMNGLYITISVAKRSFIRCSFGDS